MMCPRFKHNLDTKVKNISSKMCDFSILRDRLGLNCIDPNRNDSQREIFTFRAAHTLKKIKSENKKNISGLIKVEVKKKKSVDILINSVKCYIRTSLRIIDFIKSTIAF